MNADTPILGRRRVAESFGVSPSTLKRWQNDREIESRLRLRDFTFRMGSRVATTHRLVAQFVDHVRSIDPRETARRDVAEVTQQFRRTGAL